MRQRLKLFVTSLLAFFVIAISNSCSDSIDGGKRVYYTVTFNSNGGSDVSSIEVEKGELADKPSNPTKTGYTFVGWYSDSALTESFSFNLAITEDITLYAKWSTNQYTVTFNSDGGSSVSSQTVDYKSLVSEPTAPTKTGYTFAGWYTDSATTTAFSFATTITEDITLYAKWSTNQYTVTFNSDGGSSVSSQTVDYKSLASEPTAPTKTGYTFAGWYTDSATTTAFSFVTTITEDITLYAKWSTNQYTVTFNTDEGSSISSQDITYNTTATEPTAPTKTGYTFVGWYIDSSTTTAFSFATTITEDITLYAKWSTNQYTVTFNSDGGSSVSTLYVDYNSTATEPSDPIITGYTFAGWYSDSSLTTAFSFSTTITEDITLYAKWSINQYTVTFNSNGGSSVSTQNITYNTVVAEPSEPTKTGYTFAGWYTDSSLTEVWSFTTVITENITLYAKWVSISSDLDDMGTGNAW